MSKSRWLKRIVKEAEEAETILPWRREAKSLRRGLSRQRPGGTLADKMIACSMPAPSTLRGRCQPYAHA